MKSDFRWISKLKKEHIDTENAYSDFNASFANIYQEWFLHVNKQNVLVCCKFSKTLFFLNFSTRKNRMQEA